MDLKALGNGAKQVLALAAPLIGTALGGPLGTAAGALLSNALGTPKGDNTAAETALLAASPDDLLKLKQANIDFKAQMAQLGVTEDQLQYADVQSARSMAVATKTWTPSILSYTILGASLVAFLGIVAGKVTIPTDPTTALTYGSVLTFLFTESKSILGYWFGSSIGSDKKTDLLAAQAQQDS